MRRRYAALALISSINASSDQGVGSGITRKDIMRGLIVFALAALSIAAATAQCAAEQVSLDYLGLEISANLEMAAGKSLKSDGAVILVHDTLGHDRMELMAALQDGLRDLGVNSLAITLGLGMDKRHGMFDCAMEQDHRHEDALEEIAAWVQWLKEKGAAIITVAGHGRGANQVALYAINRIDKAVKRAVLLSPLMQNRGEGRGGVSRAVWQVVAPGAGEGRGACRQ